MTPSGRRPRKSIVSPKAIGIILALVVVAVALLGYWFFIKNNPDGNNISPEDLQALLAQPLAAQGVDPSQTKGEASCVHNLTYPGYSVAKEQFYDWTWQMLGLPREAADEKTDPYVVAYRRDVLDTGIQAKFVANTEEVIEFTITYCIPP